MKSPFIDFANLETETNTDSVRAYKGEWKSPFTDQENHFTEASVSDVLNENGPSETETDILDKFSNDFLPDEADEFFENIAQQTMPFDPEISDETWDQIGESIEYDIHAADTAKVIAGQVAKYFGIPTKLVAEYDWPFTRKWSARFKTLVEWAAAQVHLNPGLVAANLIAERYAFDYLGGKISSYRVGVDDFYDKRADVKRKVPAFKTISWRRDPGHLTDINENNRSVNTVFFKTGKDAALASAVYLKHGEGVLQEEASRLGKSFDAIPLETRFAFLRLAFNAGLGRAKKNLNEYLLKNKEVLILDPKAIGGPQRQATLITGLAIYLSEAYFNLPLNLSLKETYETDPYSDTLPGHQEQLSATLIAHAPVNPPTCAISLTKKSKIKFEFDMLLSITNDFCISNTVGTDVIISEHTKSADGFILKIDGNKIELNTKKFKLTDAGKDKLKRTFRNIEQWIAEVKRVLGDKSMRKIVKKRRGDCPGCPACKAGEGVFVETSQAGGLLKIKDQFITSNHFIFPLRYAFIKTTKQLHNYFSHSLDIMGVTQVTMSIPLASVNRLVDILCCNKGPIAGVNLTGDNKSRLGNRSDYLFNAQYRVNAARAHFLREGRLGSFTITERNFSESLTGFMILLVQYFWTGVLHSPADTETFAKAYVPLHSKTRFREMFHCLLNDDEKELFIKVFWENDNWKNLFSLAKPIKTAAGKGQCFTKGGIDFDINDAPNMHLYPESVNRRILSPTWREFVTSIIENNFASEPESGGITLVSWPSNAEELKTKAVFLELRRMGFGTFSSGKWQAMALRLFDIARRLNEPASTTHETFSEEKGFDNEKPDNSEEQLFYESIDEIDFDKETDEPKFSDSKDDLEEPEESESVEQSENMGIENHYLSDENQEDEWEDGKLDKLLSTEDTTIYETPSFSIQKGKAPGLKYRLLSDNNGVKDYVLVFAKGDELLSGISDFVSEQKITAARFTAIGALRTAKTAWFDLSRKSYKINVVDRQSELISLIGDIGLYEGMPVAHVHFSIALEDGMVQGGHLIEAVTYPTVELFMTVFSEPLIKRLDKETDLKLIHPEIQK